MTDTPDGRGLGTLISDLAQQVTTLLQTEGKLFRSEMSDKLSKVGAGGMEVLAGAMCLLAALIVLLQALVIALANAGTGCRLVVAPGRRCGSSSGPDPAARRYCDDAAWRCQPWPNRRTTEARCARG